jgi:heterodisulfide reductase subunit A-like polyferredoxin
VGPKDIVDSVAEASAAATKAATFLGPPPAAEALEADQLQVEIQDFLAPAVAAAARIPDPQPGPTTSEHLGR